MTGIKVGDIIEHKDGFHAKVVGDGGPGVWQLRPLETWAKTRLRCTSRDIVAVYRPRRKRA